MSVDRYQPHVLVLPEDDANADIANGFIVRFGKPKSFQILRPAGGWIKALEKLSADELRLRKCPQGHAVLLIDFDGRPDQRRSEIGKYVPTELLPRVFVIGCKDEPEKLHSRLSFGIQLADDCANQTTDAWQHPQFAHNEPERIRMQDALRQILFPTPPRS